jgi:hypothetical protein
LNLQLRNSQFPLGRRARNRGGQQELYESLCKDTLKPEGMCVSVWGGRHDDSCPCQFMQQLGHPLMPCLGLCAWCTTQKEIDMGTHSMLPSFKGSGIAAHSPPQGSRVEAFYPARSPCEHLVPIWPLPSHPGLGNNDSMQILKPLSTSNAPLGGVALLKREMLPLIRESATIVSQAMLAGVPHLKARSTVFETEDECTNCHSALFG